MEAKRVEIAVYILIAVLLTLAASSVIVPTSQREKGPLPCALLC